MLRRLLYTVFFCMLAGLSCQASNQKLLSRLDSILSNREAYHNSKEMYISILKNYAKKKAKQGRTVKNI